MNHCHNWLEKLPYPCGDCHDPTFDCKWCKDCNPQNFIVQFRNVKMHTNCMYLGEGVESLYSHTFNQQGPYYVDNDNARYSLPRLNLRGISYDRAADILDLASSALGEVRDITYENIALWVERDGEYRKRTGLDPQNRLYNNIPCIWRYEKTDFLPINSAYFANVVLPPISSGWEFAGDFCECYEKGEPIAPVKFWIQISVGDGKMAIQSAYEYECDSPTMSSSSSSSTNEDFWVKKVPYHKRLRVFLVNHTIPTSSECFSTDAYTASNFSNARYNNDDLIKPSGFISEISRWCKGRVYWKACNRDIADEGNAAADFYNDDDNDDLSSGETLKQGIAVGTKDCRVCKGEIIPIKAVIDEKNSATVLLSLRNTTTPILGMNDVWRSNDRQKHLFFHMMQENRIHPKVSEMIDDPKGGHNTPNYDSKIGQNLQVADIKGAGYANMTEQPGHSVGKMLTKDEAMVGAGLISSDKYKTVELSVGAKSPTEKIESDMVGAISCSKIKGKFIKSLTLEFSGSSKENILTDLTLRFRNPTNSNNKKNDGEFLALSSLNGVKEAVIDNIKCDISGGTVTVDVNLFATEMIYAYVDTKEKLTTSGATANIKFVKGSAVVLEANEYLKSIVNTDDFSSCFDSSGRCLIFYTDNVILDEYWSSSSHSSSSSSSSESSQSSSSLDDCFIPGKCYKKKKIVPPPPPEGPGGGGGSYNPSKGAGAGDPNKTGPGGGGSKDQGPGPNAKPPKPPKPPKPVPESESSISSQSSSSSSSKSSDSSLGCPHSYNLNCGDAKDERYRIELHRFTLDLTNIAAAKIISRPCKGGCKDKKGKPKTGMLLLDFSSLTNVCLLKNKEYNNSKYTADVSIPAIALACEFSCQEPQTMEVALSITATEELGRWILEVVMQEPDGGKTTIFYGVHWDGPKYPFSHCNPPLEGFRVCKGDIPPVGRIPSYVSYSDISVLVSNDLGRTWVDHKAVIRGSGRERYRYPIALGGYRGNQVILFCERVNVVQGTTYEVGLMKEFFVYDFNDKDGFKRDERPEIFTENTKDDEGLTMFSDEGKVMRQRWLSVMSGTLEKYETDLLDKRAAKRQMVRFVGASFPVNLSISPYMTGSIDSSGIIRIWSYMDQGKSPIIERYSKIDPFTVAPKFFSGSVPADKKDYQNIGLCPIKEVKLVVSGISDSECRCSTYSGAHTLKGDLGGFDHYQGKSPVAYNLYKNRLWTLWHDADGLWILKGRDNKLILVKKSKNTACPPNGSFRHVCGLCNGWIVGTISGSQEDVITDQKKVDAKYPNNIKNKPPYTSYAESPVTEDGSVTMYYSEDAGKTWKSGLTWTGGIMSSVVYDVRTDSHYLFYTTPEDMMFMKVLPSDILLDSAALSKYMSSEKGTVPIFVSGDIEGLFFDDPNTKKSVATLPYPKDFVFNWKNSVSHQAPTGVAGAESSIRFFYVDTNGQINGGIFDGQIPNLIAKMKAKPIIQTSPLNLTQPQVIPQQPVAPKP